MPDPNSFTNRFNIDVDLEEARRRFVNRANNTLFESFFDSVVGTEYYVPLPSLARGIASELGEAFESRLLVQSISRYTHDGFSETLQAIEVTRRMIARRASGSGRAQPLRYFDDMVQRTLDQSEADLGIRWHEGRFLPAGAEELDEALVDDNLRWLRSNPDYETVLTPYEQGLEHLLTSQNKPERLKDVITDVYEAFEALAKIVTGKDQDLSTNREKFISALRLPAGYGRILKEYINYACDYRHGENANQRRENPNPREVESFLYLTGVFIRLAIQPTESE